MGDMAGFVILGLLAGVLSGLVGLGGGFVIVPALVFIFGFSQHQAQGTTLALLVPPIGLLAAWTYYRQGFVDIRVAALIAVGFVVGSLLGARYAMTVSNETLEKVFGVALVLIGLKMIIGK
ncbi:MAG: TSUP family transporter [Ignavibacteriales bacterium]|nr:TSUP family transporter [Ignavibacteriales bacterium]